MYEADPLESKMKTDLISIIWELKLFIVVELEDLSYIMQTFFSTVGVGP